MHLPAPTRSSTSVAPDSRLPRRVERRRVGRRDGPAIPERRARACARAVSRRARRRRWRLASSVALVSLLAPWISAVVVAELFPEPWLVAGDELESAHPLGALPEVQMRHEKARWSAVLRRER